MRSRICAALGRRRSMRKRLSFVLMSAMLTAGLSHAQTDPETARRTQWFRDAKFGMLITWGLYSIPAGEWKGTEYPGIGEWIQNWAHIPVEEYAQLAAQFNPVKFNADEWAGLARQAGMKYVVPMPKHHDGFAMFASKASTFNIVDATPFKRDPMAEEYAQLEAQFTPVRFNAGVWAGLARQAEIKYVVPMPKHRDGFAMFASKAVVVFGHRHDIL